MLRVNVGLSRKLSKDYNSTGFSLNLEGEICAPMDDPEAVIERIREFYDLAEEALSDQIQRYEETDAIARREGDPPNHNGNGNGQSATNGNGRSSGKAPPTTQEEAATNKQIQFLLTIARRQELTTAALEVEIGKILGHPVGIYQLSKREAGQVLDALTKDGDARPKPARRA